MEDDFLPEALECRDRVKCVNVLAAVFDIDGAECGVDVFFGLWRGGEDVAFPRLVWAIGEAGGHGRSH